MQLMLAQKCAECRPDAFQMQVPTLTDFDLLQLPIRVLVEAADADIANALTLQGASKGKSVRMKSITLGGLCQ